MDPTKLNSIDKGINDWWEEQRQLWGKPTSPQEHAAQDLFNILACALGPLKRIDLSLLLEGTQKADESIDEILDAIRPFIVGDAVTRGFIFDDPQVGEYFHDRLSEDERLRLEARFLDWGHQILENLEAGTLAPEAAPSYVVQYYGAHLEQCLGRDEDLFSLVSDSWRRAWKAHEGAYDGFLDDVKRAWRAAVDMDRGEVERDHPTSQIGMEVRCALCKSSVVSLASDISTDMLGALVERKVWTPAQALAYALRVPENHRRLDILAPYLSEELLQRSVLATLAIEDWQIQAHYLIELVPYLPEAMLRETLGVVEANLGNWASWGKLGELAPHLSEELLGEVLIAAQGLEDWKARADALVALIPHLSETQLQETLVTARALENAGAQSFVLAKMIHCLPEAKQNDVLTEVLEAVQSVEDAQYRASTLAEVIRYLPEAKHEEILLEALGAVSEIEEEVYRLVELEQLIPYLTEPLAKRYIAIVRDFKNSWKQAYVLDKMAPYLPESALRDALMTAKTIVNKSDRADAQASLAPHMSEKLLREFLKEALVIDKEVGIAAAVAKLVPHLPKNLLKEVLAGTLGLEDESVKEKTLAAIALRFTEVGENQEAFRLMREVEGTWAWVNILSGMAPHLPDMELRKTLAAARAIGKDGWRADALAQLAPYVPEVERAAILEDVLSALRPPETKWERKEILPKLVPYLQEEMLQQAITLALGIDDKDEQMEMLVNLAIHIVKLGDSQKAFEIIEAIESEEGHAIGLEELVTHLPESERNEILSTAMGATRRVEDRWTRALLLGELAQSLPLLERDEVLKEALGVASEIEDELDRDNAIIWLTPFLPESLVRETLNADREGGYGAYILSCFAQRFGELGFPEEGLTLAKKIENESICIGAIVGLAPHLSDALLREALAVVNAISDDRSRAIGLAGLANSLPDAEGIAVFQEALEVVQLIDLEHERASVLSELAQYVSEETLSQYMTAVNTIEYDFNKEMTLESLASRFCELGRHEEAIKIAQTFENDWTRAKTLAELAPNLSEKLLIETLILVKDITYASTRVEILSGLSPELVKFPRLQLFELWQDILPVLAIYPREELLQDLCALMPVIAELGGTEGLVDIAQAVGEVVTWWS